MSVVDRLGRLGFAGALRALAAEAGDRPAVTTLSYPRGSAVASVTRDYAELDRAASAVASALRARTAPGARVAVVCEHGFEYVAAFTGCLYAGRVAVPLPAVEAHRGNDRITSALRDAGPEAVLVNRSALDRTRRVVAGVGVPGRSVLVVEELVEAGSSDSGGPVGAPLSALAYLQYTSGSTGSPTGVRITNGNLAANARQIAGFAGYLRPGSVAVGWVPFFHDLGLLTGLVVPLGLGAHAVQLTPLAFVQSPGRWLRAISDHRSVWMVGPNFSYDLCVARVGQEQRAGLDLGSVRGLVSGGEPVRAASQRAFSEAFAGCGLTADVDAGAYGLAEATLCVTARSDNDRRVVYAFDRAELDAGRVVERREGAGARVMASCGVPLEGVEVAVVDPEALVERPADGVGELWVRGPNVADGYWRRPELTERVFNGVLTGRGGGWLRTGDSGFRHDGLLFVAGRLKDLLVVDGRNHHPSDVEATAEGAQSACEVAGSAVFPVESDDRERVVAVLEVRRRDAVDAASVVDAVRRAVSRAHGVDLHDVLLVPTGSLPRTSSHKVRRGASREKYLRGGFRTVDRVEWAPVA
ncbi:fatty acyl-AMP ligase [Actinosynnema pretiosum subsp. pretiosum]|uniref:Fatty acyl-AMP ligase n=1 Tax=Actinosynnema pretiosum subsp. pretiosum TaxID=103721 RepID=A0AA45R3N5_9PSEU|nr:fatty acyl-AMP ligase [Actinosynnema pretiosum subsp. pretiosum]